MISVREERQTITEKKVKQSTVYNMTGEYVDFLQSKTAIQRCS